MSGPPIAFCSALSFWLMVPLWSSAAAAPLEADPAAALRTRYAELSEELEQSPLQRGLYLESIERSGASQGDIYALVDYPFTTVSAAFTSPSGWCDALILHLNVKYCHPITDGERTVLSVAIGKKYDQPLTDTFRVEFGYNVTGSGEDYMKVDLDAPKGPLGTRNYHIGLELVGLEDGRAFLHVRYSFTYGFRGHFAMGVYFATSGRGKVGFTMIGSQNGRPPHLVGGVRGAVERNVMRYYLALDAYLGALATLPPLRFEESLERWFSASELYARQLHEVDRNTYLTMKHREYLRQQTLQ